MYKHGKEYARHIHRLVWEAFNGKILPNLEIDHANRNKLDNRLCNLRLATKAQNARNIKKRNGTSSIFKGVTYDNKRNNWKAFVYIKGKTRTIGRFVTAEMAAKARDNYILCNLDKENIPFIVQNFTE